MNFKYPGTLKYLLLAIILMLSFLASSSYRAITHDEGLVFAERAVRILNQQPIFDKDSPNHTKNPARLLYTALIALSYKIGGINLLAVHIGPYLLQILNPAMFFLLVSSLYNLWWGAFGALLFTFLPFNFVCLNTQHNHAVFMFLLLLIAALVERSVKQPAWLVAMGAVAALLLLTRFTDAVIFIAIAYFAYIITRWRSGLPFLWLGASAAAFVLVYVLFALVFHFPITYPVYYIPHLLERQAEYDAQFEWGSATRSALRSLVNWYLFGKFLAPLWLGLVGIGIVAQLKRRIFWPLLFWGPHLLFMAFVFGARYDVANLEPITFSTIGFVVLAVEGLRAVFRTLQQMKPALVRNALKVAVLLVIGAGVVRSTRSLAIIMEDAKPASTMWHIARNNPPLPGNPAYAPASIALNATEQLPVPLMEQMIQQVRGAYRSGFKYHIGTYAFDHGLPEQAALEADFSYADTYRTTTHWEAAAAHVTGNLWQADMPGHLGASPYGASAEFMYRFEFPQPIMTVTLSDIHTQWGFGDRVIMWTSTDGDHWTLRYDNHDLHYTEDRYYQFFDTDFRGARHLFIKYAFKAGDTTRAPHDNSGASLREFALAAQYLTDDGE